MVLLGAHQRLRYAMAALAVSAWTGPAWAAVSGHITFAVGDVSIVRGNNTLPATKGAEVLEGDQIRSGADGIAQIRMVDSGLIAVRRDTTLRIDRYQYSGKNAPEDGALVTLLRGTFRSFTGLIAAEDKSKYVMQTPSATIGIRGTGNITNVAADGTTLNHTLTGSHVVSSTGLAGAGATLYTSPGDTVEVRRGAPPRFVPTPPTIFANASAAPARQVARASQPSGEQAPRSSDSAEARSTSAERQGTQEPASDGSARKTDASGGAESDKSSGSDKPGSGESSSTKSSSSADSTQDSGSGSASRESAKPASAEAAKDATDGKSDGATAPSANESRGESTASTGGSDKEGRSSSTERETSDTSAGGRSSKEGEGRSADSAGKSSSETRESSARTGSERSSSGDGKSSGNTSGSGSSTAGGRSESAVTASRSSPSIASAGGPAGLQSSTSTGGSGGTTSQTGPTTQASSPPTSSSTSTGGSGGTISRTSITVQGSSPTGSSSTTPVREVTRTETSRQISIPTEVTATATGVVIGGDSKGNDFIGTIVAPSKDHPKSFDVALDTRNRAQLDDSSSKSVTQDDRGDRMTVAGVNGDTTILWGRWISYKFDERVPFGKGDLHYILPSSTAVTMPLTGTFEYNKVGGTQPTNDSGQAGTLNSASLSANFRDMTATAKVITIIDKTTLTGATDPMKISPSSASFQTNSMSVSCGGACSQKEGSGRLQGSFFGQNAAAAGFVYRMESGSQNSNGAVVLKKK